MAEIIVRKPEKKGVLDPHTVQKIIGVKDFVALPTTPVTPTLNQHLVRKKYVDDNFGPLILTTNGDILYYNSGHQRLAKGSDSEILTLASGLPSWAAAGAPGAHAASHTDGTDDIQNATDAQKGVATAAQITKLDGIEATADITDATNVNAAGAVMNADFNAKGDLLSASANDTPLILGVGTNDQVLTADSAQATGLKWAAAAGGGKPTPTKFVAADDAVSQTGADYTCDAADDEVQINTAIDAIATTGGIVMLSEGTFKCGASIRIRDNVALIGSGPGTIVTWNAGFSSADYLIENYDTTNGNSNLLITQMLLSGGDVASCIGVYLKKVTKSIGANLWFKDWATGFKGDTCEELNVLNNFVYSGGVGLYFVSSNYCAISNNLGAACSSTIFYLDECSLCALAGNIAKGGSSYGLFLDTCQECSIVRNAIYDNGDIGFYISKGGKNIGADNVVYRNDAAGITISETIDNLITGNMVYANSQGTDDTSHNIHVGGLAKTPSAYNFFSNNLCRDGGGANQPQYGLRFDTNTNNNVTHGNDLYNSGRTGDYSDGGTANLERDNRDSGGWIT